MRNLPEVVSDIFTYHGAVMEKKEENRVEFIATEFLSKTLGIPEYGNLDFSPTVSQEEAILASYDSELLKSMEKLFSQKGKISVGKYPPCQLNVKKFSNKIAEKIAFSNATFRLGGTEKKIIKYLLFHFRYIALSDERKEGMVSLMINTMNSSTSFIEKSRGMIWDELTEPKIIPGELDSKKIRSLLLSTCSAATIMIREKLDDFVKSLERRLNLDIKKGNEYYEILKEETKKTISKKILSESDPSKAEEIHNKSIEDLINSISETDKDTGTRKLFDKLSAIDTEQKWKINDLIAKYSLNVQIEPISVIQIETESNVFLLNIRRRQLSRQLPVTYNPITKQLDPLPCESCFYPRGSSYVCDDKLHIICANCFKKCSHCGKQYCCACHKKGCPKCGK